MNDNANINKIQNDEKQAETEISIEKPNGVLTTDTVDLSWIIIKNAEEECTYSLTFKAKNEGENITEIEYPIKEDNTEPQILQVAEKNGKKKVSIDYTINRSNIEDKKECIFKVRTTKNTEEKFEVFDKKETIYTYLGKEDVGEGEHSTTINGEKYDFDVIYLNETETGEDYETEASENGNKIKYKYDKDSNTYTIKENATLGNYKNSKTSVLKVEGNLVIDENVTVTVATGTMSVPMAKIDMQKSGGSSMNTLHTYTISTSNDNTEQEGLTNIKGLIIYTTGTITNKGIITMSGKGTYGAESQNIYLYTNKYGIYEYIPKQGVSGGAKVSYYSEKWNGHLDGNKGEDGKLRSTGGGGSGSVWSYKQTQNSQKGYGYSGNGSSGTSFSGGAGGGAASCHTNNVNMFRWRVFASDANGSVGGIGNSNGGTPSSGGAGSFGGFGAVNTSINQETYKSPNGGTGGLLIIYGKGIKNEGTISSDGSSATNTSASGGSAGGGSINLFYQDEYNTDSGTITANGGAAVGTAKGGAGGSGSITVTQLY